MNEHDRYKRAFSVLHASAKIDLEAEMKHRPNYKKRLATVSVCAALLFALTVSAFAVGGDTLSRLLGWDGHIEVHKLENEIGETIESIHYGISEPVRIEDGRMYFIANGEEEDITDIVTKGETYSYTYEDGEGYTYLILVGLNAEELESYGYAEFIKTPEGSWCGGHAHNIDYTETADGEVCLWLEQGKEEYYLPW